MTQQLHPRNATEVKLHLLSYGISLDDNFHDNYDPVFIEKRWAYGNSDEVKTTKRIPQELLIGDIISAVHLVPNSDWRLGLENGNYVLKCRDELVTEVSFPKRPRFYEAHTEDGVPCKSVGTLYGGSSLGIFALGTCYYFRVGKQCGFCSLEPTRDTHGDHMMLIKPKLAAQVTEIALREDPEIIKQVMLNGGNRNSNDDGFLHHIDTLERLHEVLLQTKRTENVELHLIAMPPDNHRLLDRLRGLPVKVAMNLEVFSPELFPVIAPGKAELYGRKKIIQALEKAVEVLGVGNVYTIFVGGLEPLDTLVEGLNFVAELGVVPIINVFHRDPTARLANYSRVNLDLLRQMGQALQAVFYTHKFKPFYKDCGRNSLDSEAFYSYF